MSGVESLSDISADLEVRYLTRRPRDVPQEDTQTLLHRIEEDIPRALKFHRDLPECSPTPLVDLGQMEGVGRVFLKDEGQRMGMKAFKVLGGTFAVHQLETRGEIKAGVDTLTTMTDGNHGAGLAYAARRAGYEAVVYVPKSMVTARRKRIEGQGARIIEVDGGYEASVAKVHEEADRNGWVLVGDTSWTGYETVPRDITTAYSTIFSEAVSQMWEAHGTKPTHVFLQAGVGSFAAGGIVYCHSALKPNPPNFVIVEPTEADCILENIKSSGDGSLLCKGSVESVSAGLNCGVPAYRTAWPIMRDLCSGFVALGDGWPIAAVRELYELGVVSGESGCCGYAALMAARNDAKLKEELQLDAQSVILVISTEGATDPVIYNNIIGRDVV